VALGGCAALRSLFAEPYPYNVEPGSVKIHGPVARAVGVAFNDFIAQLAADRANLMAWDPDAGGFTPEEIEKNKPVWDCTDSPSFYDAWYRLDDGGTRYIIDIYPKPEVCFGRRAVLFGGGAIYEIDAKSFTILKKEMQE
jgi:hypothetical protein